jgi:hypothetical protein
LIFFQTLAFFGSFFIDSDIQKQVTTADFTIPQNLHKLFGGKGIRTPDFQLAKLALYQLSYAPL